MKNLDTNTIVQTSLEVLHATHPSFDITETELAELQHHAEMLNACLQECRGNKLVFLKAMGSISASTQGFIIGGRNFLQKQLKDESLGDENEWNERRAMEEAADFDAEFGNAMRIEDVHMAVVDACHYLLSKPTSLREKIKHTFSSIRGKFGFLFGGKNSDSN